MDAGQFLQIENKYDLYHLDVGGVNYWVYHRNGLWNQICAEKLVMDTSYQKKNHTFDVILKKIRYVTVKSCPSVRADILFLSHSRRVKNENYYDCIYTDELAAFYKNSASMEEPFQGQHFQPVRTQNLMYVDQILFCASLYWRTVKFLCPSVYERIQERIREQIHPALEELRQVFGWTGCENDLVQKMTITVLMHRYAKKKFRHVLETIRPKVIVEVVHYSFWKMVLNELAREMGILTIELQHGVIYSGHIAYQYVQGKTIPQLPQKLFTFSDFWKKQVSFPSSEDDIVSVGYPTFDRTLAQYRNNCREDTRYTILFVSQPVGNQLSQLAKELSEILPQEQYRMIFKLHPFEYSGWEKIYPELTNSYVEVVANNNHSIYKYLSESDMQIGVFSTAIYEGLGFELETLILRAGKYEAMQSLVDTGAARYIDCTQDVLDYIASGETSVKAVSEDFWKPNALENMRRKIYEYTGLGDIL